MQEQSLSTLPVCWPCFCLTLPAYMIHVDAAVEYSPHDIAQTLNRIHDRLEDISNRVQDIDGRMEGMGERMEVMDNRINNRFTTIQETLQIGHAQTANLRIINRNTRLQAPNTLQPLQKTVRHSHTTSFNY